MTAVLDVLSWALLLTGAFLGVSGAIGLFRFPDFFTRMHAASITDTLCMVLILAGLGVQAGLNLVAVKLVLIALLVLFTSPVAGHALAKAALGEGVKPRLAEPEDES